MTFGAGRLAAHFALLIGALASASCRRGAAATTVEAADDAAVASVVDSGPVSPEPPVVVPGCHDGFCLVKPGMYVMGSPPSEPDRSRFGEEQWDVTFTRPVLFGQHVLLGPLESGARS